MGTFVEATAIAREATGYSATIDPEWFIWGPFGGYLAAIALRAMAAHTRQRRPATFSCQYLNVGAAGAVRLEVETRKAGRRAECLRTCMFQAGKPLIEAQSWIVAGDLSGLEHDHARMPQVRPPSDLPSWDGSGEGDESRSPIWRHIERRPTGRFKQDGCASPTPQWSCWLRLSEALPEDDVVLQAARAILWMDVAPWNAALARHGWPTTHIAPTLDLTVQFQPLLYGPAALQSDWLLAETESPSAAAGMFGAHSMLWSNAGELVAVGAAQGLCVPNGRYEAQRSCARRPPRAT